MRMTDFRQMLADVERLYAAAGAKVPAKDMAAISDALATLDGEDFDTALELMTRALDKPSGDGLLASEHLSILRAAGVDQSKFDQAMKVLEADKSIKAADLDEIGSAYTNSPRFPKLYKTRPAKLKRIREAFRDKREFESRGKVIDDLVPWQ